MLLGLTADPALGALKYGVFSILGGLRWHASKCSALLRSNEQLCCAAIGGTDRRESIRCDVPLTAIRADDVLDATVCTDDAWEAVHKARPRARLLCRACAQPMHAKLSPIGTRFFAHDRKVPDCPQPEKPLFTAS